MEERENTGGGGGLPGWVIWIGILIGINIIAQVFDLGFYVY